MILRLRCFGMSLPLGQHRREKALSRQSCEARLSPCFPDGRIDIFTRSFTTRILQDAC